MSKSGFGISTISSVPLVFNIRLPGVQFRNMELYFPDTACHYTDDPQAFILPRLPFLFRSRDRIWKNDRRTQRMDPGSAELPASSHDLFPGRILTGVLRYLPCQQLYASNHPTDIFPRDLSGIVKKTIKSLRQPSISPV